MEEEFKSKLIEKLKSDKAMKIIIVIGFAVIALIFLSSFIDIGGADSESVTLNENEYQESLEQQLTEMISEINGVGTLTVMITMESTSQTVLSDKETSVTAVIKPQVRGVAVVCEGGGDIIVKTNVTNAVSSVLGISSARICVTN